MKKNILIFCAALIILNLTACGHFDGNDGKTAQLEASDFEVIATNTLKIEKIDRRVISDFVYDVGPRFNFITKSDLDKARSFSDFIGEAHVQRIVSYTSLSVTIFDGEQKTDLKETGNDGVLTTAQVQLLQSSDYSTNVLISAEYREKNIETGQVEDSYWTPYLTIVPEKQANFVSGKESLIDYLKAKSKDVRANVKADKLKPAKLLFTVTKNGTIENVKIDRSSGYPSIDKKMIELITKTQAAWESALNADGEKVDQELVISFGLMGC